MTITKEQIQTFKKMYELRYNIELSDEKVLDIINNFLSLINIIKENESRHNLR